MLSGDPLPGEGAGLPLTTIHDARQFVRRGWNAPRLLYFRQSFRAQADGCAASRRAQASAPVIASMQRVARVGVLVV